MWHYSKRNHMGKELQHVRSLKDQKINDQQPAAQRASQSERTSETNQPKMTVTTGTQKKLTVNLRELRSRFITAPLGEAGVDAQLGAAYLRGVSLRNGGELRYGESFLPDRHVFRVGRGYPR